MGAAGAPAWAAVRAGWAPQAPRLGADGTQVLAAMRSGECGCCLGLLCARRSPTIAPPPPPLFAAALFGIARGEANPAVAARHVGMPSAEAARGAAPQSANEMNDPRELAARSYYASRNLRLADDPFAQALMGAPAYACPPARASAAPRAGSGPPARASAAHFAAAAPARASAAHFAASAPARVSAAHFAAAAPGLSAAPAAVVEPPRVQAVALGVCVSQGRACEGPFVNLLGDRVTSTGPWQLIGPPRFCTERSGQFLIAFFSPSRGLEKPGPGPAGPPPGSSISLCFVVPLDRILESPC